MKFNRNYYLIQRYELRSDEQRFAKGVGRYLSGDYMGAAEFEWGAVPKAWADIRGRENKIVVLEIKTRQGGDVTVLCPVDTDTVKLNEEFASLAKNEVQTKEWTNFDRWFSPPCSWDGELQTVAWLSVGDHTTPVFWTVDPHVVSKVMPELMKAEATPATDAVPQEPVEPTVDPEDLRMFDTVEFKHHGRLWTGKIKGIYAYHLVLAMPQGGTQRIAFSQVTSIKG